MQRIAVPIQIIAKEQRTFKRQQSYTSA